MAYDSRSCRLVEASLARGVASCQRPRFITLEKGGRTLGARQKLNAAYLNGALLVAALIGTATESWSIFLAAVLIGIGVATLSGDIRPDRRSNRRR